MESVQQYTPLNILLAEDDIDDRFFFNKALKELSTATHLTTVNDGEQLMKYLSDNPDHLPDIIFLDISMPRKNGYECLSEMKGNKQFKNLYVVIFSTFYSRYIDYGEEMIKKLHGVGMDEFIRKPHDFGKLKEVIHKVLITATRKRALKEQKKTL